MTSSSTEPVQSIHGGSWPLPNVTVSENVITITDLPPTTRERFLQTELGEIPRRYKNYFRHGDRVSKQDRLLKQTYGQPLENGHIRIPVAYTMVLSSSALSTEVSISFAVNTASDSRIYGFYGGICTLPIDSVQLGNVIAALCAADISAYLRKSQAQGADYYRRPTKSHLSLC